MVVIVDPHLKRTSDYPVYKSASDLGIIVKPKSGEGEYEGWCWTGSSSWIDFFNPASWDWWIKLFRTEKVANQWTWTASTDSIHIWNDMNEVTVYLYCFEPDFDRFPPSHPFSMVRKSLCPKIMFIMEAGSIAMSTISTECSL